MEKIQVKPFSDLTGREVFCLSRIRDEVFVAEQGITAVSYTHLTLPTICSV